jgi:hypothetical protein
MDFDAGNVFRQVAERAGDGSFGVLAQCFATCDVIVGIDLDFHDFLLVAVPGRFGGWGL